MKTCLTLFSAILLVAQTAALTPQQKTQLEQSSKSCASSSGAKADQVAQVRSGKFPNDPEIQKYIGCMMRSAGVINQSGQLQLDVLKSKVPKDMKRDEAMRIFFSCKDKRGDSPDKTAYLLYQCFWNASPTHMGLDGQ